MGVSLVWDIFSSILNVLYNWFRTPQRAITRAGALRWSMKILGEPYIFSVLTILHAQFHSDWTNCISDPSSFLSAPHSGLWPWAIIFLRVESHDSNSPSLRPGHCLPSKVLIITWAEPKYVQYLEFHSLQELWPVVFRHQSAFLKQNIVYSEPKHFRENKSLKKQSICMPAFPGSWGSQASPAADIPTGPEPLPSQSVPTSNSSLTIPPTYLQRVLLAV